MKTFTLLSFVSISIQLFSLQYTALGQKNFYWNPSSGSNADNTSNWRRDSCNGATGTVPGSSDTIIYSSCSTTNCDVDLNFTVAKIDVRSTYSGTITMNTGKILSFKVGSFKGGTFDGGTADVTSNISLTIDGSVFKSTTGTMTMIGDFTFKTGTFNHQNGKVVFKRASATTTTILGADTVRTIVLYDAEFSAASANSQFKLTNIIIQVNDTLKLTGSYQLFLNHESTGIIAAKGNIKCTNSNTVGGGTASIVINGTSNQTFADTQTSSVRGKLPNIKVDKSSGTLYLVDTLALGGGAVWEYHAGTVNIGTSKLICHYNNTLKNTSSDTMKFYNLEFQGTGDDYTIIGTVTVMNLLLTSQEGDCEINAGTDGLLEVRKDLHWYNEKNHYWGTIPFKFTKGNSQTISSIDVPQFYSIIINKTGGDVTLQKEVKIENSVTFSSGYLVSSSSYPLTFLAGSTSSGASATSFVKGPVKKYGNTLFSFPVGKGSIYHPVEISAPSSTSDAFTGEYFNSNQTLGSSKDTLSYLSSCEYWKLDHNAGSSNVTVKLSWDTNSCNIHLLSVLRVARWTGSLWTNLGQSVTTTGNSEAGTIKTNSSQSTFGYFMIAKHSSILTVDAGSDAIVCQGTKVQVGGSPIYSGGEAPVTFKWTPVYCLDDTLAANPYVLSASSVSCILTVTDADQSIISDTAEITVNPGVHANAGVDQVLQKGSSFELGGTPTCIGGVDPEYEWLPTDELNDNVIANPTTSPSKDYEYQVIIVDKNDCTDTDEISIVVLPFTLGVSQDFALLSADSIIVSSATYENGSVGANTYVDANITASGDISVNDGDEPQAITDFNKTLSDIDALTAEELPNLFEDTTINAGIYHISGSLTIRGHLSLTGNLNSYFVFIVSDTLMIENGTSIQLQGMKPSQVFFRTMGNIFGEDTISLAGVFLASGNIILNDVSGAVQLLANGEIKFNKISNGGNYNYLLYTPPVPKSPILRSINPNCLGVNTQVNIKDEGWGTPNTYDDAISAIVPGILRFPSGTPCNFWRWETGWLQKEYFGNNPIEITKTVLPNLIKPDFRQLVNKANSSVLLTLNMLTSDQTLDLNSSLGNQMAMMKYFEGVQMPVKYVELGEEFYFYGDIANQLFPTASDYGKKCNDWIPAIHTEFPDAKICVVAVNQDGTDLRRNTWNSNLFSSNQTLSYDGIDPDADAASIHFYPNTNMTVTGYQAALDPSLLPYGLSIQTFTNPMFINGYNTWSCLDNSDLLQIPPTIEEIWLTEFNLNETAYSVHGTWAHGLFLGQMLCNFLTEPRITLLTAYDLIESAARGCFFTESSDFDFNGKYKGPPDEAGGITGPDVTPELGELTVTGQIIKEFEESIRNSDEVAPIDFDLTTGNGISSEWLDDVNSQYPAIIGTYFTNSATGDVSAIILNLNEESVSIEAGNLFTDGSYYNLTVADWDDDENPSDGLIYHAPFVWICGNANASGEIGSDSHKPTLIKSSSYPISGPTYPVNLPAYSLTKINFTSNNLSINASNNEFCDGESVLLQASGGTPPYVWTCMGDVALGSLTGSSVSVYCNAYNTGTGSVQVTDAATSPANASVSLTIDPSPDISITGTTCGTTTQTLTAVELDVSTFSWYDPLNFINVSGSTCTASADAATYVTTGSIGSCRDAEFFEVKNTPEIVISNLASSYPATSLTGCIGVPLKAYQLNPSTGIYGLLTGGTFTDGNNTSFSTFDPYVNPSPITYTIGTGGCTSITQDYSIDDITITASKNPICPSTTPGDYGTVLRVSYPAYLNSSPNYISYNWYNSSQQPFIPVQPTTTTTYTCTVTYVMPGVGSCSLPLSYIVDVVSDCCEGSVSANLNDHVFTDISVNELLATLAGDGIVCGNAIDFPNYPLVLNGTFTVDNNLTLMGNISPCSGQPEIKFGDDAKIEFAGPYTLEIDNNYLHACESDKMWDGIHVENSGGKLILNKCVVEDAMNAVYAKNGGGFELNNVIFNKNYKDLVVEDYTLSDPYPGKIQGCTLECEAICLESGSNLIESAVGDKTYEAIEVNNVNNLQIGDPNGIKNTIINYQYGIKSTASDLTILHNDISYFDGLVTTPTFCFPPCELPINIYTAGDPSAVHALVVGGNSSAEYNTIDGGFYGIYAENNLSSYIDGNTFTNIHNPVILTKFDIPGYSVGNIIEINSNSITDCLEGISVTANEQAEITINSNQITLISGGNPFTGPIGIAAIEPSAGIFLPNDDEALTINNNVISGVQTGIFVNSISAPIHIEENNVDFDILSSYSTFKAYGIHVLNSTHSLTIADNMDITSPVDVSKTRGIQVDNSSNYSINNNKINNCERGIVAYGPSTIANNTSISCNEMFECKYGFSLEADANIGQQGDASHPSNNTWTPDGYYDVSNINGAYHTWSESQNGNQVIFWTLSGNIYRNDNNGTSGADPIGNNVVSSGSDDCPTFFASPLDYFEDIATGGIDFAGNNVKSIWLAKQALYNALKLDSTLRDSSTVLSDFYDTTNIQNIGKTRRIQTQIRRGMSEHDPSYFDDASSDNSAISSSNDMDANHKLVNEIYLSTILAGVDTFTQEQIDDLETIAQMCYAEGGEGAYQAMALLSYAYKTTVVYDCEESELKNNQIDSSKNFFLAYAYPNPTTGLITIENFCTEEPLEVQIFNEYGDEIITKIIPLGLSKANIFLIKQPAGLYFIYFTGCKTTDHQMIVKIQ